MKATQGFSEKVSRRRFLATAAAVAAAPMIVPASALGKAGRPSANERITVAAIGLGMQGPGNMGGFLGQPDCQVVAVCDLDKNHLNNGRRQVDRHYQNSDCVAYQDFREVMARKDIDAVSLAVPDHWHAIIAIAAAVSGKDIYGEKPLSHTLAEGRAMVEAVKRYGRVWQTGSWQRSVDDFRFAAELVRNGRIGKVHTVEVGLPSGHTDFGGTAGQEKVGPPPEFLDYEMWLGPAPAAPYCPARVHCNWRWVLDHGGGQLMDWIGHHGDIAHWGMDCETTGPIEVEGTGNYPRTGLWNTAGSYRMTAKYRNGITMIVANDQGHGIRMGTKWIGTDGWVWVDRGGIDANPKSLLAERKLRRPISLYRSPGHIRNFLDCVKSRQVTIAPVEVAHRSASIGHLGQIAMLLGRKLRWNPDTEEILGDPTASRMLSKSYRAPWHL